MTIRRLLVLAVFLACGSNKELPKSGVEGASCSASSDCTGELQCLANVCSRLEKLRAAEAKAREEAEAEAGQEVERQAELAQAQARLDELKQLETDRAKLDEQLATAADEAERVRLLVEKKQLDERLDALLGKTRRSRVDVKVTDDPLDGL